MVLGLFLEPANLPRGFLVGEFVRGRFSRGWFVVGDGGQQERWEEELVWLSREDVESKSKVMSFGRRRLSWNCGSL